MPHVPVVAPVRVAAGARVVLAHEAVLGVVEEPPSAGGLLGQRIRRERHDVPRRALRRRPGLGAARAPVLRGLRGAVVERDRHHGVRRAAEHEGRPLVLRERDPARRAADLDAPERHHRRIDRERVQLHQLVRPLARDEQRTRRPAVHDRARLREGRRLLHRARPAHVRIAREHHPGERGHLLLERLRLHDEPALRPLRERRLPRRQHHVHRRLPVPRVPARGPERLPRHEEPRPVRRQHRRVRQRRRLRPVRRDAERRRRERHALDAGRPVDPVDPRQRRPDQVRHVRALAVRHHHHAPRLAPHVHAPELLARRHLDRRDLVRPRGRHQRDPLVRRHGDPPRVRGQLDASHLHEPLRVVGPHHEQHPRRREPVPRRAPPHRHQHPIRQRDHRRRRPGHPHLHRLRVFCQRQRNAPHHTEILVRQVQRVPLRRAHQRAPLPHRRRALRRRGRGAAGGGAGRDVGARAQADAGAGSPGVHPARPATNAIHGRHERKRKGAPDVRGYAVRFAMGSPNADDGRAHSVAGAFRLSPHPRPRWIGPGSAAYRTRRGPHR